MSDVVAIEFASPDGEQLRFEWSVERLRSLDPAADERCWSLGGELDWDEVERVRVLSARIGDGLAVAIAALLPSGAAGHGEGPTAGILLADEEPERLSEVLLSVEQRPAGEVRRIGLELYRDGGGMPVRVAGDATAAATSDEGGIVRERVAFELRSAGVDGVGVLETLRRTA